MGCAGKPMKGSIVWACILIHNPLENMTGNASGSNKPEGHKAGKVTRWQVWLLAPWPVHGALNVHAGLLGPVQSPTEQMKTHYKLLMWLGKAHNLPHQFYFLTTRQLNPWSLKPFAVRMCCARSPWVLVPTLPPPDGLSSGKERSSSSEALKRRHSWTMQLKMPDLKVAEGLWAQSCLQIRIQSWYRGVPSPFPQCSPPRLGQSVVGGTVNISGWRTLRQLLFWSWRGKCSSKTVNINPESKLPESKSFLRGSLPIETRTEKSQATSRGKSNHGLSGI